MKSENTKRLLIAAAAILAAVAVFYYIYTDMNKTRLPVNIASSTPIVGNIGILNPKTVPLSGTSSLPQPIPKLDRPFPSNSTLPADARVIVVSNIKEISSGLAKNPADAEKWVLLGTQYKIAGDYEGAREAWEYATLLSPTYYVPFNNLGDLYAHYIKNYPTAEHDLKKAISLQEDYIDGYRALYELYRYSYAQKASLAPQVLKDGLKQNPKSTDLMVLLAQYYKESGDKTQALSYYNQALVEAQAEKNTSLADLVNQEIQNLNP